MPTSESGTKDSRKEGKQTYFWQQETTTTYMEPTDHSKTPAFSFSTPCSFSSSRMTVVKHGRNDRMLVYLVYKTFVTLVVRMLDSSSSNIIHRYPQTSSLSRSLEMSAQFIFNILKDIIVSPPAMTFIGSLYNPPQTLTYQ